MKNKIIFLVVCFISVFLTGCYKKNTEIDYNKIVKESIQTHEYFSEKPSDNKYFITSKEELDVFSNIYSDVLSKYSDKFDENSLFVMVFEESSGSNELVLEDVNFDDNKVEFIIEKNYPEIGTDDMAFWYLVALIPNDYLIDVDLTEWKEPSEIINVGGLYE